VRKIPSKKKTYTFCHTADWHLDYFQYQKRERWQDFFKAANNCAELMIKEKPDFILHCGDLFHQFRPSPGAIRLAIKILNKFKAANIPFYIIRGNHDASKAQAQRFGGTILKFLEELGFVIYIQDETISFNEDIAITGIGEYGKSTAQVIEEVLRNNPIDQTKFNILVIHGYLQGQVSDSIFDISGYQLASLGYDYIAVGHYHKKWEEAENNIYCPGSTEQTSINDWGKPEKDGFLRNAGFYSVKISQSETGGGWEKVITTKEFPVRPKGRFTFTFTTEEPTELILQRADAFVKEHDLEGAIIRYDFIGEAPLGKQALLNFAKLPSIQKAKALHVIVNSQITSQQLKQAQTGLKMEEALIEILKESYGYKDTRIINNWVDLIKETVRILGQKTFSSEESEEIKDLYAYISEETEKLVKKDSKSRGKTPTKSPKGVTNKPAIKAEQTQTTKKKLEKKGVAKQVGLTVFLAEEGQDK